MECYLQAEGVSRSYGDQMLFSDVSFGINRDQKIALIAKNGTGKTSLLRILAGLEPPDTGQVSQKNDLKISYLPQEPDFDNRNTVLQQVFQSSSGIMKTVERYQKALTQDDKDELQHAMEQMDRLGAWDYEVRIKQILSILKVDDFDQKLGELSGGQKKRLALANALMEDPDLLIMDEPTNHLDLEMIEWLEEFLTKSKCTLFMVTHDRYFLDRVCNEILEMEDNTLYKYKGNYSYFLEKREERLITQGKKIDKANRLMSREKEWINRMPKARGTKAKYRIDNFQKIKEEAAQRINNDQVNFDIKPQRLGSKVLNMYNLAKSYGENRLIEDFSHKFAQFDKIGIVGKNGTGKSTLLKMIMEELKPDSGRVEVGETVEIGYYQQDGMQLMDDKRLIDVIKDIAEYLTLEGGRKMSASEFLERFLFPSQTHYQYVSTLSGGEKRRLYLMTVLMRNPNFLILDEPTNDLDIMTLNVLEEYLISFKGCVLIVSHDRYFMDKIVDSLFVFQGDGKIKHFPGNYSIYREVAIEEIKEAKPRAEAKPKEQKKPKTDSKKVSYKEKREYELLTEELEVLGTEKETLETTINSGSLSPEELQVQANRIGELIEMLDEKEMRWLELSELIDG